MKSQQRLALTLSTLSFAVTFMIWGMISPLARSFQTTLHLTDKQVWVLITVPILLGAAGQMVMGMLADRIGGRMLLGLMMMFLSLPAFMLSLAHTYQEMLLWAVPLGIAGASFSIGVPFTSKWFPPERQGTALGIYGAGSIGQSLALFGVPILSGLLGSWQRTYQLFALITLVYGILFLLLARDAPAQTQPKPFSAIVQILATQPLAWLLALFSIVTFGGFVALGIGLPNLLQEIFHLTREDASLRVAGLVLLATVMIPIGGALSDRVGGAQLLMLVFTGAGVLALGMTSTHIAPLTIGALGVAVFIGLGNGAVFKLVPHYFARDTGTVTGLVGAIGGLGGLFSLLLLGFIRTQTGSYAAGFILLSAFCFACLLLNHTILLNPSTSRKLLSLQTVLDMLAIAREPLSSPYADQEGDMDSPLVTNEEQEKSSAVVLQQEDTLRLEHTIRIKSGG